ncbi:GntR family transcriptional regulator [Microbacterium sp. NPDC058389]|uniref:GntR family transcriptional regulator n=1 Tax=Microbacterium sp. NPDC058389 TaxID=3346475 RepID=UPI003656C767
MTEAMGGPLAIRPDYPEALWIQARKLIVAEITSGALEAGRRLPPERELCQQLSISRVTLRKALASLVEEGVLMPSHGRGWYVAAGGASVEREWPNSLESFTETAARMGLEPSSKILRSEVAPGTYDEAEELGLAPGTPLFVLERVRLLNGVPIAVDRARVPAFLDDRFLEPDYTVESLYERLAEAGVSLAHAETTIEAQKADAEVAESLDLKEFDPILAMHQLVIDDAGRRVLVSDIRYSGERYRLRTTFSRSMR